MQCGKHKSLFVHEYRLPVASDYTGILACLQSTRYNMNTTMKPFLKRLRRYKNPAVVKDLLNPRKLTWKRVLRTLIALGVFGILLIIFLFAWYYKDLPRPGDLKARTIEESTILYDRNGNQIYDISGDERRILLKAEEIPDIAKKATIAIEDRNFYSHPGLDFRGLARAVLTQGRQGGGSTITQQYVKNAILSPKRTLTRKIKELIISLELEAMYSKDEILTMYLNEIPYGSNIYGIEAASQAYFGHSAKDGLTIAEAATLAAIPQAPTRYSPYGTHVTDALIPRKNRVIDAMVRSGFITQEEADKAKAAPPLVSKDFAQRRENFPAPHFVMYVREQLVAKYGEEMVQRGGLRVTTTLDLEVQKLADQAVKEQGDKTLPRVKASNAAMVALDPKTGQLLAMVGSRDYFDREHEGNFNVATAQRQPGSSIKPLVYANLFKGKWAPGSVMWDVNTDFNNYSPNNFDGRFHGPLTIRKSLGNSYNIPAVKALSLTGIKSFIEFATDLGITTYDGRTDAGLSLALGGGEVKMVDLAAAYGVLANGGERAPLTSILAVKDSSGKVLDEWKENKKRVLDPEIAYQISHILADPEAKRPVFSGLLNVLSVRGKTVAVKTGTTNNYKDAWTVGYTPSIVAAVWAGNNDNTEMDHGGGSTAAAPIWDAFMESFLSGKSNEEFHRPAGISEFTTDMLSNKKPTQASGQLITDIFASWQIPTEDDDVHQRIKVCRSNGLLATDETPAEEIEERIYTQVRSERPDNPAWQNPVIAWARSQGIQSDPPTEKCTITFTEPKVSITDPANNATVSGLFTVAAAVTFPPSVSGRVEFLVDDVVKSVDESAAYSATLDSSTLSPGQHVITALVQASNGTSARASITVTVAGQQDATAPGEVSGVTVTPGPGAGKATILWKNPSDSDLATVAFYVSQTSGTRGTKLTTVDATPGAQQTTILSGLVSGTTNYITIVPSDKSGNSTQTSKQYSVKPL